MKLNSPLPEYQRRPVYGDADERRSHEAARLLSGTLPQLTCPIYFRQAGIGTYTRNVVKTPVIETVVKLRDQMLARSLGDHIKGISFSCLIISMFLTNIPDEYKFLMQTCPLTAFISLALSYRIVPGIRFAFSGSRVVLTRLAPSLACFIKSGSSPNAKSNRYHSSTPCTRAGTKRTPRRPGDSSKPFLST